LLSIAVSDLLLLIVRPDQQDFQGTAVAVELARRLEVPEMMFVVNKVLPVVDLQAIKDQVEALFKGEVAAVLTLNNEMVRLASGDIFVNRYPEHPFTRELERVARRILR
jgi:MinD-like ATPase involved in chromosome partitioning or flagellar assembly